MLTSNKFHGMKLQFHGMKYFLRHFCVNHKFAKVYNLKGEISK